MLLTLDEAAGILGLDRKALRRLAHAGLISWYEIGVADPRFDLAVIRAFDRTTPVPSKVRRRHPLRQRLRFAILERDGFRCRYCGASAPDAQLVIDHIRPVADGGSDDPDNLCAACFECNAGKSGRPLMVQP